MLQARLYKRSSRGKRETVDLELYNNGDRVVLGEVVVPEWTLMAEDDFIEGWGPFGPGNEPRWRQLSDGLVEFCGLLAIGAISGGTPFYTMPLGYRPDGYEGERHYFCATDAWPPAVVRVEPGGGLKCSTDLTGNTWVDLSTVKYGAGS